MNWLFYALLCAFFYGIEAVYLKYLHKKGIEENTLICAMFLYALPLLFIPASIHGFREVKSVFWIVLVFVAVGNGLGFYFYSKAIKNTDVSLAAPVLSISPLVVVFFSWIFLMELPPAKGFAGMLCIVIGLAFLTAGWQGLNIVEFIKNRGVKFALITVLIWEIVASIDKVALGYSAPMVYPFISASAISAVYLFFAKVSLKNIFRKETFGLFACLGFINAGLFLTHMLALNTGYVSYVIAIKRSGVLISIIVGKFIFKEKQSGLRAIASLFILLGLYFLSG